MTDHEAAARTRIHSDWQARSHWPHAPRHLAAALLALTLTASGCANDDGGGGGATLRVGVAAIPITPCGVNPQWDGPITPIGVWGEEITDVNGNGIWDSDIREPFVDDPVNTEIDAAPNGGKRRYNGIFLAGFGSNRLATGCHDDIWARVIVIDDGSNSFDRRDDIGHDRTAALGNIVGDAVVKMLQEGGEELDFAGLEVASAEYFAAGSNVDLPSLTFGCKVRLPMGERQVVFLSRTPEGLRCVQPSGTQFPAEPADDGDYTRAVRGIADALRLPEAKQVTALHAALIPALRANATELRYHAGLELAALAHPGHPLTAEARRAVEAARADASLDPSLRPLLARVLRADP